ncbi:hypothetical protein R3P38DRAFT_2768806 [Favolaschia claudopus]|uniref:Uncharacterized protein n=1 Tax=Favolaschia claudopus TaxID=2862362 RepID=A0AAW0CNA6_9AGAR
MTNEGKDVLAVDRKTEKSPRKPRHGRGNRAKTKTLGIKRRKARKGHRRGRWWWLKGERSLMSRRVTSPKLPVWRHCQRNVLRPETLLTGAYRALNGVTVRKNDVEKKHSIAILCQLIALSEYIPPKRFALFLSGHVNDHFLSAKVNKRPLSAHPDSSALLGIFVPRGTKWGNREGGRWKGVGTADTESEPNSDNSALKVGGQWGKA